MDEQVTCGKGLAANASLPAAAGELMAAMADVLDAHQAALDLADEQARPEHHAYVTIVVELRSISALLAETARSMVGYRDVPMGRHDGTMMAGALAVAAFRRFVRAEERLHVLLNEALGEHAPMLNRMEQASSHSPR